MSKKEDKLTLAGLNVEHISVDAMKPNDTPIKGILQSEYPTTDDKGAILRQDIQ